MACINCLSPDLLNIKRIPGRHHRRCTRCTASLSSCCCPSRQLPQAPARFPLLQSFIFSPWGESNSCDKFIFLITLQPSSSLLPAGSGSVLPIPFVEWRPGSSFSTYSACQMCSEFQKGTKMKTTVEQWGFSGCQHLKLSYDEDTLFRSYMLPRATSQRRRRPVLFLLLVEQ